MGIITTEYSRGVQEYMMQVENGLRMTKTCHNCYQTNWITMIRTTDNLRKGELASG
jgi:hypothetical protein